MPGASHLKGGDLAQKPKSENYHVQQARELEGTYLIGVFI